MLREFDTQALEEAMPPEQVRVKRAVRMLRDFPKDPAGEAKVSLATRKERQAALFRHGFTKSQSWMQAHKRAVVLLAHWDFFFWSFSWSA